MFLIKLLSSFIISDNVPVGGFCSSDKQCTGSYNSGICENGRCTCKKGFTLIDLACEKGNANQIFISLTDGDDCVRYHE